MKKPKAVDLPNYGVLECELEEKDFSNLWTLVHKYAPNAKWEGNRLPVSYTHLTLPTKA